jgi:hypothetical protein
VKTKYAKGYMNVEICANIVVGLKYLRKHSDIYGQGKPSVARTVYVMCKYSKCYAYVPVEMWDILSARPAFSTAATESEW